MFATASALVWTVLLLPTKLIAEQLILPVYDQEPSIRLIATAEQKHGYLYGPSKLGNTSFFPSGHLGTSMVLKDVIIFGEDNEAVSVAAAQDEDDALKVVAEAGGLKKLEDFKILYQGQWKKSIPYGIDMGVLANGSTDLQFSMERLSASPFSLRRLHPEKDQLPFAVEADIVSRLTGVSIESLHERGRLFFVDHSDQLLLPKTSRYSAACSAYFYLSPQNGKFLPLAIKTNTGANLIYTPLDSHDDWLLAKVMMNSNEAIFNQIFHIAATHSVQEIVHQAALRTLNRNHPVLALLDRLMYGAYAPRQVGEKLLTGPDGFFDKLTSITGDGAKQAVSMYYHDGAGAFQSNYFVDALTARGLLNCTYGPALPHFPFYEDGSSIYLSLKRFMSTFVNSYYKSSEILRLDDEIQTLLVEARDQAQVIDFPHSPTSSKKTLIQILTHFAFLSVTHNTLNGDDPVAVSSVLPFHPASLHAPLPTEKGITNIMQWLPDAETAAAEIKFFAGFNRPTFAARNLTLLNAFNNPHFLAQANEETRLAEQVFRKEMGVLSEEINSRRFDAEGLSQGMPFIWTELDPARIPLSSCV